MQLKPVLGLVQLLFYSVGVIVGAGGYSVLGAAAGLAQHGLWISFLLGAGVALLTAISYAEMATLFPAAGAERDVRAGIGLSNTRARLESLFGASASVTLRAREGGGAVTEILLPYLTEHRARSA